jgi:hypothetical protein
MSIATLEPKCDSSTWELLSDQAYRDRTFNHTTSGGSAAPQITMEASDPFCIHFRSDRVFEFDQAPPAWFTPILDKICELGELPADWDSYGAMQIDPETAAFAIGLLLSVLKSTDPLPTVVPTSRGGLMFEWHDGGIDLEIDIQSPLSIHVAFVDETLEEEFENPLLHVIHDKLNVLRRRLAKAIGL